MLFLGVKLEISHKWFRKTICSVDIILDFVFAALRFYFNTQVSEYYIYNNSNFLRRKIAAPYHKLVLLHHPYKHIGAFPLQ